MSNISKIDHQNRYITYHYETLTFALNSLKFNSLITDLIVNNLFARQPIHHEFVDLQIQLQMWIQRQLLPQLVIQPGTLDNSLTVNHLFIDSTSHCNPQIKFTYVQLATVNLNTVHIILVNNAFQSSMTIDNIKQQLINEISKILDQELQHHFVYQQDFTIDGLDKINKNEQQIIVLTIKPVAAPNQILVGSTQTTTKISVIDPVKKTQAVAHQRDLAIGLGVGIPGALGVSGGLGTWIRRLVTKRKSIF